MKYPEPILSLIQHLRRLPGVGNKTAERYAFELLNWKRDDLQQFSHEISHLQERLQFCPECGCLQAKASCTFCTPIRYQEQSLCIIASPRDVYAIDTTQEFKGVYHVLGGLLSPLDGFGPDMLQLGPLIERMTNHHILEVIFALDSTLEGDTTSLYLKQQLEKLQVKISRLAFGLPMGSSLQYVDGGTLAQAFAGRSQF